MILSEFNKLEESESERVLRPCCGSTRWIQALTIARPYSSLDNLLQKASEIWFSLDRKDWLEAFSHHPKIGDLKNASGQSRSEQKGVGDASPKTLEELATLNREYEAKFDYIYLICAKGRSADEMLHLLKERISNSPESEIAIAAREHDQITQIRLKNLFQTS